MEMGVERSDLSSSSDHWFPLLHKDDDGLSGGSGILVGELQPMSWVKKTFLNVPA